MGTFYHRDLIFFRTVGSCYNTYYLDVKLLDIYIYIFKQVLFNKIATRALANFFSKFSIFRMSFLMFSGC